ncbi:MAG: arginine deiminase [Bacteroidales bacterium]|jgi:arginine deiminase|nr:arginine deiminase [Bacteroidales bacterium]
MLVNINSEIGELTGVIIHTPGKEIEQMTPQTISKALYSDLLNLNIAQNEYSYFNDVLKCWTQTFQVKDLLAQVLADEKAKKDLITKIIFAEHQLLLFEPLMQMDANKLSEALIEGLTYSEAEFIKPNDEDKYILPPLYNFFFTRDASTSLYNKVLINSMKSIVRERETFIMDAIFQNIFQAQTISPKTFSKEARTEGGDILIAKNNVLFVGCGTRTNKQGIDFLIDYFANQRQQYNIIVQELPENPESFIHLDMVFTMLSKDKCMVYEPLILKTNSGYNTTHIEIDNGKVTYHEKNNLIEATKAVGFDFFPVLCGGNDKWNQEREQWHSGANFFALGEGKVIGYSRNRHTIDALNKVGFEVLRAVDVVSGKVDMKKYKEFVITFDAAELPRGGGGARCMTMPVQRAEVMW